MKSIIELEELASSMLSEKRYLHTLAVSKLAGELAELYGEDVELIQKSAILHDITKEIPMKKQRNMLKELNNGVDYDIMSDNCIHSITGYYYAKDTLGIENELILNGILYHTTGRANMSLFEKIIFTADKVSYDRDYPEVKRLRELAFVDLNNCMVEILKFVIPSILKKNKSIVIDTINCYNGLLNEI